MGYILFGCFAIGIMGFGIWYGIRQNKSVIDRAKKIDPTVKTMADAQYVLKKDLLQSINKTNNDMK